MKNNGPRSGVDTVTPDMSTQLLHQGEGVVDTTQLRVGQRVKVWFTGPVMESYPLQATAGVIAIEPIKR